MYCSLVFISSIVDTAFATWLQKLERTLSDHLDLYAYFHPMGNSIIVSVLLQRWTVF